MNIEKPAKLNRCAESHQITYRTSPSEPHQNGSFHTRPRTTHRASHVLRLNTWYAPCRVIPRPRESHRVFHWYEVAEYSSGIHPTSITSMTRVTQPSPNLCPSTIDTFTLSSGFPRNFRPITMLPPPDVAGEITNNPIWAYAIVLLKLTIATNTKVLGWSTLAG